MSAIQQMMIGGGRVGPTLMSALTTAALTTNLKLCLDAGDSASYDPAVQTDKWLDRSGAGYDFFRGSGTGSDAADPTFSGPAGNLESVWTFDGGDYFTYDAANETWMQNLHKNNAIFSIISFSYWVTNLTLVATSGDLFTTGINFRLQTAGGAPQLTVSNATALVLGHVTGDTSLATGVWHMTGISLNEATGAGGGFFYSDGNYNQVSGADTFNSTYSSPSAGNATSIMQIAARGDGGNPAGAGSKIACMAVWQGTALTKANMDTIWAAMRGRFGI